MESKNTNQQDLRIKDLQFQILDLDAGEQRARLAGDVDAAVTIAKVAAVRVGRLFDALRDAAQTQADQK